MTPEPITVVRDPEQQMRVLIRALTRTNFTEGKVCGQYEVCNHDACASSHTAWSIANEALHKIGALPLPGDMPVHDQRLVIEELPPIALLEHYQRAFEALWTLLVAVETGTVTAEVLPKLRAQVSAVVFGPDKDPDAAMAQSVAWFNKDAARDGGEEF